MLWTWVCFFFFFADSWECQFLSWSCLKYQNIVHLQKVNERASRVSQNFSSLLYWHLLLQNRLHIQGNGFNVYRSPPKWLAVCPLINTDLIKDTSGYVQKLFLNNGFPHFRTGFWTFVQFSKAPRCVWQQTSLDTAIRSPRFPAAKGKRVRCHQHATAARKRSWVIFLRSIVTLAFKTRLEFDYKRLTPLRVWVNLSVLAVLKGNAEPDGKLSRYKESRTVGETQFKYRKC